MPIVNNTSETVAWKRSRSRLWIYFSWSLPQVSRPSPGIYFLDLCRRYHGPAQEYTYFLDLCRSITAQPRNILSWSLPQVSRPCWRRWIITTLWWPLTVQYSGRKSANITWLKKSVLMFVFSMSGITRTSPTSWSPGYLSWWAWSTRQDSKNIPSFFSPSRHSQEMNPVAKFTVPDWRIKSTLA